MSAWFGYAVGAFFLMGFQGFLYKVAAERRYDTARTTFIFMTTVALLSSILWISLGEPVGDLVPFAILTLINSLSFLAATMTFIEALKFLSATTAYSVIRLNLLVVTIFSLLWFGEHPSPYQIGGIAIALAAMLVLTRGMNGEQRSPGLPSQGLVYLVMSLFAAAIASISSKFAAMYVGKLPFLTVVYGIGAITAIPFIKKPKPHAVQRDSRGTLVIGVAMGVLNFGGYYAFLTALSEGPLSLVASITGMHFVVSVVLSILFYGEKLTTARIVGFALTIISLILLRF